MSSYAVKSPLPPPYEPPAHTHTPPYTHTNPAAAMSTVVLQSPTTYGPPPVIMQQQPQVITYASPPQVVMQPQVITVQQQQPQAVADNVAISAGKLGGKATITTCTNCRQRMETRVLYKSGWFTWAMCILLVCVGLFFGCCLIPFFMNKCKDAHHYCTLCNKKLCVHKPCC
ncbi:lipopolysaccharide-induced tumor necrosis factor-alpha factor homolog [Alosa pseudoharengus]|uniref:lipopolysaccharide-induced tumor necrosis factor-alpha factor homolog n=1 Tax=Alosa pseudoharengus TaxID=34774 RepID=UPI003F888DCE